jgi:hypothetical protein
MGPKNLLILFFSTVAVSLVILIIFFSLFFKNVNLDFNTRLPESAPDVGGRFDDTSTMSPDSKADGLMRSTVNVPPDFKEPEPSADTDKKPFENKLPGDAELPPVSDDALLEDDYPKTLPEADSKPKPEKPPLNEQPGNEKSGSTSSSGISTRGGQSLPPARMRRPAVETTRPAEPLSTWPSPIDNNTALPEPETLSAPPVPQ